MRFYMVRTFDHAGYYETRLVLAILALVVAAYFLIERRDSRFLVIMLSGVIFQALLEYRLQAAGLRGADYGLSVFGAHLRGWQACVFQGLAEGGILALMSFWFVDAISRTADASARNAYVAACVLIVVLALAVGIMSRGAPITSVRPMFGRGVWNIAMIAIVSIALCWLAGGLRWLWYYYAGCLIYVFLTFEPLQITGARYIAVARADGGYAAAPTSAQIAVMLYSHLAEVAAAKLHYFAVPFALRLVRLPHD
jgi:hypothetical protein